MFTTIKDKKNFLLFESYSVYRITFLSNYYLVDVKEVKNMKECPKALQDESFFCG